MRFEDAIALGGEHEREARAMEWAVARGHSCEVKLLDRRPISWRYSVKGASRGRPIRRHLEIYLACVPAWLGDLGRHLAMEWRIFRDHARGIENPYRTKA